MKLMAHAMEMVERVLEQRVRKWLKVDEMQSGFAPRNGTTDPDFIVRRI